MTDYGKAACAVCGNEFEKRSHTHRYCSKECYKAARSARFRNMSVDEREAYNRAKRVNARARKGTLNPRCEICGKVMHFKNARKYCSLQCIELAKKAREQSKRVDYPAKPCANCGSEFKPAKKISRFCCKKCMNQYHYRANIDKIREYQAAYRASNRKVRK